MGTALASAYSRKAVCLNRASFYWGNITAALRDILCENWGWFWKF